jgi:hypothetical protein
MSDMSRQVYLLVIGIAVSVTLPFAWFVARQYGGWWGAAYAFAFSTAATHLTLRYARRGSVR